MRFRNIELKKMCIFCKPDKLEIVRQNEKLMVVKDIKPATEYHYLVIPKEHTENVKYLNKRHVPLVEDMRNFANEYAAETFPEFDQKKLRLGFHWAPFNTIDHLHLHILYPIDRLSMLQSWIFRPGSYWFIETKEALEYLEKREK